MADHPYSSLPERAFWSPAVAKRHMLDMEDLWQPQFVISQKDRIATFGSCFAQHFSRAILARGYTWLDGEPAPTGLSPEAAKELNYGVFSARTGNIYTTSLLRQWVEWALDDATPPKIFWEKDGRILDPFRPMVEPNGFGSVDEMLASRAGTIAGFRRAILSCNIFVFTLGLTESWWDTDGFEYPMCPGTVGGTFDPDRHVFRNLEFEAVQNNLIQAIKSIRVARKGQGPRVLLTVSPVPLTATNSGNHVLVATSESKATLRTVAGSVTRHMPFVDYFPSYEIITAPPFRGSFFEPNMRSVHPSGVAHVMQTFFNGQAKLLQDPDQKAGPDTEVAIERAPMSPEPDTETASSRDEDLVCEEELLAAFGETR